MLYVLQVHSGQGYSSHEHDVFVPAVLGWRLDASGHWCSLFPFIQFVPLVQVLLQLANQVNSQPLPDFTKNVHGLRLPHEDDCLLGQPYHYVREEATGDTVMALAPSGNGAVTGRFDQPQDFRPFSIPRQGERGQTRQQKSAEALADDLENESDEAEPMEDDADAGGKQPAEATEQRNEDPDAEVEWL